MSYSQLSEDQKLVFDILERKQKSTAIKIKDRSFDEKTVITIH